MNTLLAIDTGLKETAEVAFGTGAPADLMGTIGGLLGAGFALLGVIFLALMIYGGYLWMTAQGSDEKVKKAIKTISSAAIGLVVIVLAYAITSFVLSSVQSAQQGGGAPNCRLETRCFESLYGEECSEVQVCD
ncbi:MAG: hypothetical protein ACD_76C00065G0002 [uncultured bacterium]|nr:MAG: hypothetical protein ACD_76C00065G0002 [uncultured bacterium]HBD05734.1 hypothetical protein [Candidatus Uhrbacteria bacterium]